MTVNGGVTQLWQSPHGRSTGDGYPSIDGTQRFKAKTYVTKGPTVRTSIDETLAHTAITQVSCFVVVVVVVAVRLEQRAVPCRVP